MKLVSSGITDLGRKRDRNEDCFLINEELRLFVVADGMGGHAGGEYASAMAVNTVEEIISGLDVPTESAEGEDDPVEVTRGLIAEAVGQASRRIYDWAQEHPEFRGMGTTAVVMFVHGGNAYIAHVGDSRLYALRDGEIEQVTEDHSLVAESIREGLLTVEEARTHRMRNVITRALGFKDAVVVDVQVRAIARGDKFLLCSDGLSGQVEDHEIRDVCLRLSPRETGRDLVGLACARGGDDNITVVVVQVEDDA